MTRKKGLNEDRLPPSGVDRVLLPQQYAAVLFEALEICLGNGEEWVSFWAADDLASLKQMMRKSRAFAKSFIEHPKEMPNFTARLKGKRVRFQVDPIRPLCLQMAVRTKTSSWEFFEEV